MWSQHSCGLWRRVLLRQSFLKIFPGSSFSKLHQMKPANLSVSNSLPQRGATSSNDQADGKSADRRPGPSKAVKVEAVDRTARKRKLKDQSTKEEAENPSLHESQSVLEIPRWPSNKWVGAHVSIAGGIERAPINAAAIGARAFALDVRSKRRWETPDLSPESITAFKASCQAFGFGPAQILPHGSYLINLGSPHKEVLAKSFVAIVDELRRCEQLGITMYNIHPGSSCGKCSAQEAMDQIADYINRALAQTQGVKVVLECTAGSGSTVGDQFEQLHYIISRIDDSSRIGVCLDTCHMFAAGYDISTKEGFDSTMEKFGEVVGWNFLCGMHINDSKAALGSKKDRHENIGKGQIGESMFRWILNDSRFDNMPLIMETPVQDKGPGINYKQSLLSSAVVFKEREEDVGIGTDKRDIQFLYSLVEKQ